MRLTPKDSPWSYPRMLRKLSYHDFQQTASLYLTRFQSASHEVLNIYEDMYSATSLLPSDCDHALDTVKQLQQSVLYFSRLLDSPEQLPNKVVPNRYRILFSLHYLDKISYELIPLLRSFRQVCLEPSQAQARLHGQILRKFETILETSEKIQPESEILLN